MEDLSIIYYTSNHLDDKNPYFLNNTRKQLEASIENAPLIVVSQKPVQWARMTENIIMAGIGRSHLNIYRQILAGAKAAKSKWVALAEDDMLYSNSHFNFQFFCKPEFMNGKYFIYDQNRISIFTWSKPPIFSMRFKRVVVNSLIAPRDMLVEAMEERFRRLEELKGKWEDRMINKFWGDPGRYEGNLGVTVRPVYEYYAWIPSIVFSHEYAYGYEFNQGKRKKLGDLRIVELADWGRAEDILKLYKQDATV